MKKTLFTVIAITLLMTICACTNMASPDAISSRANATSEPFATKEPAPTMTPDVQPTPLVTQEPEDMPEFFKTMPPIPQGFSDAELMENTHLTLRNGSTGAERS